MFLGEGHEWLCTLQVFWILFDELEASRVIVRMSVIVANEHLVR